MSVHVTIGTTGPHEGVTGGHGRRVRSCFFAAVPRVGEYLEVDGGGVLGRFTGTEIRHRPQSTDLASDLNDGQDRPGIHIEALAWDMN
jgi:hypothetical protein